MQNYIKTFIDTHTPKGRHGSFLAPTVAATSLEACCRHRVLFHKIQAGPTSRGSPAAIATD